VLLAFAKQGCLLKQTYEYLCLRVTDKHFKAYSQTTFPLEYHCRYSAQVRIKVSATGKICQTALY